MTTGMLQVYRDLLDTAGLVVTDDDCISMRVFDEEGKEKLMPFTIKGDRLVLPTDRHKKIADWTGRIAFHPLSENTARGESQVLERFRAMLNARLNHAIPTMMRALLRIGSSKDDHAKLNPDQSEFLSFVKHADAETVVRFLAILKKMPINQPSKQFVNIFLKRSAKLNDGSYFRGGIVSFPFYQEMLEAKESREVRGVKLRVKDYETFMNLLDYILPHQGEVNYYSRGSDSRIAPSIDAIMKAVMAVAGPLNDKIELFGELVPVEPIPAEWAAAFDNLQILLPELRDNPMMLGNEGTTGAEKAAEAAQTTTLSGHQAAIAGAPTLPMASLSGYGSPAPVAPVVAPSAHRPLSNSKTTDLDSLLRSNPALAASVGYHTPGMAPQQQLNPHLAGRATLTNPVAPVVSNGWNQQQQRWPSTGGWNSGGNQGGGNSGWGNAPYTPSL